MRFGDICETKKLDAKGENADLKMFVINEIFNQLNVSTKINWWRLKNDAAPFYQCKNQVIRSYVLDFEMAQL